ncbi:MAG: 4Fe-4S binding protein [Acutalibacteraceae bacterium]|jgi:2-oxoglutarate ferredoxin oxidoreductase subunit delta
MAKLTFETDRCKGCELCVNVCPKKVLALSDKINKKGHHPVEAVREEDCIACAFCATMCPDCIIKIER